jgi:four helix bundle protein
MEKVGTYRDLIAWQKARTLVVKVYGLTSGYPGDEKFGLTLQSRRCAVSIPSNIAEGWGRQSRTDYLRFLRIARGSTYELQTQLMIASDLGFAPADHQVHDLVAEVARVTNGLIQSLEGKVD